MAPAVEERGKQSTFIIHSSDLAQGPSRSQTACRLPLVCQPPPPPRGRRSSTSTRTLTPKCTKADSKIAGTERSAIRAAVRASPRRGFQGSFLDQDPTGKQEVRHAPDFQARRPPPSAIPPPSTWPAQALSSHRRSPAASEIWSRRPVFGDIAVYTLSIVGPKPPSTRGPPSRREGCGKRSPVRG
jgi:hypothetical protein